MPKRASASLPRHRLRLAYRFGLLAILSWEAGAQEEPPGWVSEGPYADERHFSLELPLEVLANKLYVTVEMGGKPRRLVFDTGSPSMISRELAAELDLEAVDSRKGRDSHGAIIESDIAQADLKLGAVTFHKVPVFVADFSASRAAQCLIGDGVLGSEMLPLCTWQIDLPDSALRCNTRVTDLDHIDGAQEQRLYDFGYPHAPLFDVRFAEEATSKAMFDTGSPGYFAISPPDFEGARRAGGIDNVTAGFGSLGGALGGQAPNGKQLRGELVSLSIGGIRLGRVDAHLRESPPSLIGASILEHFIVSLDARSQTAFFEEYREAPFSRRSFGFALGFDQAISVSLVWEDSAAAKAGLRAGQRVTSINGTDTEFSCGGIRRALQAMAGETIEIAWEGGAAELARETARAE